jgi:hypothetical protein
MKVYSFSNVTALVNGVQITGFGEGDAVVDVEYAEGATDQVGADGRMVVSLSADKSMSLTLKVQQTSSANTFLNRLMVGQRNGPSTFIPVQFGMKDSYRQDLVTGANGYMTKVPKTSRGVKANDVEWMFRFETGTLDLRDPAFAGLATAIAEAAGATG